MKVRRALMQACLLGVTLLMVRPAVVKAQFDFITNNGAIIITQYTGPGGAVVIPATINGSPVSSIGDEAFSACFNLTKITLPDSVTSIGVFAFDFCTNLTGVTFGNNVTSIGYSAFSACTSLTNITLPDSVTNIDDYTFYDCPNLTSFTIGNHITSIGFAAFSICPGLTNVMIGSNVTSIGDEAFDGCGLTGITIPASVTNIESDAFDDCASLTSITVAAQNPFYSSTNGFLMDKNQTTLVQWPEGKGGSCTVPDSVTTIGDYVFENCAGLTNVTMDNRLTTIGDYAFYNCGLTGITIPGSVTNIEPDAFDACASLTTITVAEQNIFYSSTDGVLFDKKQTTLVQWPEGKSGAYTTPGSVTNIGDFAFAYGDGLTGITLGNGVTRIGDSAFYDCIGLTNVTMDNCVTSIGDEAFADCGLTSITLGDHVASIGYSAFDSCPGLTSITIPASVTNIADGAFYFCYGLTGVYFTGDAPAADASVFDRFNHFTTVYYLPGTTGWGATFGGRPTAPWLPSAQTGDASFGVNHGRFGFNVTWASGMIVEVEASSNLTGSAWQRVATLTLAGGTSYFSDPQWTNYPGRYYRIKSLPAQSQHHQ